MPIKKFFNYDFHCVFSNEVKKTIKDVDRIEITKCDDEDVKLEAFADDERVRCIIGTPDDDRLFDFNICAKTAIDILYKDYDMTPKPKRKLYNGKIFVRTINRTFSYYCCVGKEYGSESQVNRIFDVEDGKVHIGGHWIKGIYEDMTDEELSKLLLEHNNDFMGYIVNFIDGYFVR